MEARVIGIAVLPRLERLPEEVLGAAPRRADHQHPRVRALVEGDVVTGPP
jgi:hypothetical protein